MIFSNISNAALTALLSSGISMVGRPFKSYSYTISSSGMVPTSSKPSLPFDKNPFLRALSASQYRVLISNLNRNHWCLGLDT